MLRRVMFRILFVLIALVVGAVSLWWIFPPDPVSVLRGHHSPLAAVERRPLATLGPRVERWRLVTSDGDTVSGLWRRAGAGVAAPWTVVLLGGLVTGDRAALLLPADLPVNVLAMDWPWKGPRKMPALEIVRRLPEIRTAVLRSPSVLALGVDAVARQPEVDRSRVLALGASLGVPPTVAALRLTAAPRALVLIDGGGDLEGMCRAGLERERVPRWLAVPIAALAARLVHPLEPSLHGEVGTRRRVLLLNSRHDQRIPAASIERLHRTFPQAETRWSAETHLNPRDLGRIAGTAHEVTRWLEE
jgi:hypothetical protein